MRDLRSLPAVLAAITLVVAGATPAPAQTEDVASKRREAQQLEARIQDQGARLSGATESYNEARLERERLDARAAALRSELGAAEERWRGLKVRLGERARVIYMHPALWIAPYLSARSLSDVARARALSSSVVGSDSDLLIETQKARAELERTEQEVASLNQVARSKEQDLRSRQLAVEREMRSQRVLLGQVQGEIGELVEAQRRREAAAAARRASAEQAPRASVTQPAPGRTPAPTRTTDPSERAPRTAGPVRAGAAKAVETAAAQIGKPYEWGADGPDSYDCSGLTQYAWKAAGVSLPHSSRAQYSSLPKVTLAEIQPGDLLFYGNPIHHVGIYEGNGIMINAPQTGDNVKRSSIYRKDFTGAARP